MKDINKTKNVNIATAAGELISSFTGKENRPRQLSAADFIALLEPIEDSLYYFVLKSVNFSQDANDVYQDAIRRGMKRLKTYNTELSFRIWIFSIANNQIRTHYRKKSIQREISKIAASSPMALSPGFSKVRAGINI